MQCGYEIWSLPRFSDQNVKRVKQEARDIWNHFRKLNATESGIANCKNINLDLFIELTDSTGWHEAITLVSIFYHLQIRNITKRDSTPTLFLFSEWPIFFVKFLDFTVFIKRISWFIFQLYWNTIQRKIFIINSTN